MIGLSEMMVKSADPVLVLSVCRKGRLMIVAHPHRKSRWMTWQRRSDVP